MKPLGYFGLESTNQSLESITSSQAKQIISACSKSLNYGSSEMRKDAEAEEGVRGCYFDFRNVIDKQSWELYGCFITKQPVQLLEWAVQFAKF